jgi:hypothetical protein
LVEKVAIYARCRRQGSTPGSHRSARSIMPCERRPHRESRLTNKRPSPYLYIAFVGVCARATTSLQNPNAAPFVCFFGGIATSEKAIFAKSTAELLA